MKGNVYNCSTSAYASCWRDAARRRPVCSPNLRKSSALGIFVS